MKKKRKKFIVRVVRKLFQYLFVFLLLAYALLHTPMVQDRIAERLSDGLSQNEMKVDIKGLRGFWPFYLSITSCTLSDSSGEFAKIRTASVHWRFNRKQVQISKLELNDLDITRLPESSTKEESSSSSPSDFPEWPIAIDFPDILIHHFRVGEGITGVQTEGRAKATLSLPAETRQILATITLDTDEVKADVSVDMDLGSNDLQLGSTGTLLDRHAFKVDVTYGGEELMVNSQIDSPDALNLLKKVEERLHIFNVEFKAPSSWLPGDDTHPLALVLDTTLQKKNGVWDLQNHVTFPWGQAEVPILYEKESKQLSVSVDLDAKDLSPLGQLLEQPLRGSGKAQFRFSQNKEERELTLDLQSENFGYGALSVDSLDLTVLRKENGWEFSAEANRKVKEEVARVRLNFLLTAEPEGLRLESDHLRIQYPPWDLKNQSTLTLHLAQGTYTLSPLDLTLNDTPLQVHAEGNAREILLDLQLPEREIDQLPFPSPLPITGKVNASLKISGTLDSPTAQTEISLQDLQIPFGEGEEPFSADATLQAQWNSENLEASVRLIDRDQNQFDLELTSPEGWSLAPFSLPWKTADFRADLQGAFNLSSINTLRFMGNQRLKGNLQTDLTYERKAGKPKMEGRLYMENGLYENYVLGTKLDQIAFETQLKDDNFELTTFKAITPGGGSIEGHGNASHTAEGWSSEIQLRLDKARTLHLDPVKVALSGGIQLKKVPGKQMAVNGRLVLENTTFEMDRLPSALPKPVPFTVKGAESPRVPVQNPKPNRSFNPGLTGNISLEIPGRLTVEAKNLYSVWEGRFDISFRENGTYLIGKLSPRRGTVKFFSRSFTLSSGNVHFNGLILDNPMLDLEAVYVRKDLEALLKITGNAMNPTFSLQSIPPMPQDEILSRILFGKDMSTITALQALEVGMALSSMMDSNRNRDWDFMGRAKNFLGVDQLELRESGSEGGNAELVAGRQINNRLYFELNKNLHEPGSTFVFEYEIRRNLSITTETGTHSLPGLGVNWKKDY